LLLSLANGSDLVKGECRQSSSKKFSTLGKTLEEIVLMILARVDDKITNGGLDMRLTHF
jgi:hypothetical protein